MQCGSVESWSIAERMDSSAAGDKSIRGGGCCSDGGGGGFAVVVGFERAASTGLGEGLYTVELDAGFDGLGGGGACSMRERK